MTTLAFSLRLIIPAITNGVRLIFSHSLKTEKIISVDNISR